jgi:alkylation response protein AidB-like acyl-CoA dehydrogenase
LSRASVELVCDGVDTKGVEIIRNVAAYGHDQGTHSYIRYADVRVPGDHLLGERGEGSSSPRQDSAAAASTTPCAPSVSSAEPSR